jgi:hypothetical protein
MDLVLAREAVVKPIRSPRLIDASIGYPHWRGDRCWLPMDPPMPPS